MLWLVQFRRWIRFCKSLKSLSNTYLLKENNRGLIYHTYKHTQQTTDYSKGTARVAILAKHSNYIVFWLLIITVSTISAVTIRLANGRPQTDRQAIEKGEYSYLSLHSYRYMWKISLLYVEQFLSISQSRGVFQTDRQTNGRADYTHYANIFLYRCLRITMYIQLNNNRA